MCDSGAMFNVYTGTPLQRQRAAQGILDLSDNNLRTGPVALEVGGWDAFVAADAARNELINQRVEALKIHNNNMLRDSNIDQRRIRPPRVEPGVTDDNDDDVQPATVIRKKATKKKPIPVKKKPVAKRKSKRCACRRKT